MLKVKTDLFEGWCGLKELYQLCKQKTEQNLSLNVLILIQEVTEHMRQKQHVFIMLTSNKPSDDAQVTAVDGKRLEFVFLVLFFLELCEFS